jgi:DNA polymerase I-like protein with 3'-5' exonuclease and polymerase domains
LSTMSLFPIASEWVPPDRFPDLSEAKEIAIDLETCDPNMESMGPGWPRNDGFIVGYAVAVDGWSGYFPVAHGGGGNLDRGLVERWIQKVLELPADKIMHNAAYDAGWLLSSGFKINGRIIDTMVAAPILDENRFSYSLNALGFDYLKEVKSEQGLKEAANDFGVHPKKELWKLPAMYVGVYAEQDAALTLKLWQHFKILLRKDEVDSIFTLETDLLPIIIELTRRGIRFDRDKCERQIEDMRRKEEQCLAEIKKMAGSKVDVWAAASIAVAFDKLGISYPKTTTGLPSFTRSFLDDHPHPVAKLIIQARELNKTHGTFLSPYLNFSAKDGRIHPHVNQLRSDDGGTVTGRLSMANPNLQQVPARHEIIGPMVRSLFLPEDGQIWAANDFSSQEPRILIHYAHLLGLPGAEKVVEAYRENPDTDFYQIVADAANIPRKMAKTCIAEGQLVLTDQGLVPIEKITLEHKLWDGVEWVEHDGLALMGVREVITYGDLTATPDHDVWTVESGKIPFGLAASRLDALVSTGNAEQAIRYVDSDQQGDSASGKASIRQSAMQLWQRGLEAFRQPKERKIHDVQAMHYAQAARAGRASCLSRPFCWSFAGESRRNISALHKPQKRWMEELWGTGNTLRISHNQILGGLFAFFTSSKRVGGIYHRSNQQQRELCPRKLTQSNLPRKQHESTQLKKVYDILNAGPRHRFTVSGKLVSNCSLGMMYGMGKQKLANSLDLPLDEASELIATFHQRVPFLRGTIDAVMKRIENRASGGSIRTLLGRKCRFPLWEPVEWGVNKALPYEQAIIEYGQRIKRAMTYKGLNRLIQGSAADQTKASMVALHKAGFRILLQVHDEIALSVDNKDDAVEASRIMAQSVSLEVPSRVDVECGPSWGEAA